jgi:hypothetical protein
MIGGIDLNGRTDLRAVTDRHLDNVENDAAEVEKDASPKPDVKAVVTEKRRPDFGPLTDWPSRSSRS